MAQPKKKEFISVRDYLENEAFAEYKSEYFYGDIFAMSGASHNHNLIAMNIATRLHTELRDSDCFVYAGDMKVQVDLAGHYTYPDVTVVCGDISFVGTREDTIANPLVIFEILSESAQDYDRGSKFTAYRNILSLKDYVLADQYGYHVEHFSKDNSGRWILAEYKGTCDKFQLISVATELSSDRIYDRVKW